jgi:hypothetical protein
VVQLCDRLSFPAEAFQVVGGRVFAATNYFQCNGSLQFDLQRLVDNPHAAAP